MIASGLHSRLRVMASDPLAASPTTSNRGSSASLVASSRRISAL